MYTVYMHTTPDNKRYVGVTSKPVATRWGNGHGYSVNVMFSDAIKKHGWNNIKHEVLLMCENCDEAGLTQGKVAKKLGIEAQTMTNKMRGKTKFDTEEIRKICDCVGITSADEKVQIFLS